jgi:hypothetical protein
MFNLTFFLKSFNLIRYNASTTNFILAHIGIIVVSILQKNMKFYISFLGSDIT